MTVTLPTFHPSTSLVADLEPETLAAQREINLVLAQMPHPDVGTPDGLSELRALTRPPQAATELDAHDVTIDGPRGQLRLHIFTPAGPIAGVAIRIHGGGFAAGSPEDDEALNDQITRSTGIAIVSPEYTLAPDVTLNEQVDECVAATLWVSTHAQSRFRAQALLLAGTSAGATLAAATLLRLRDLHSPTFEQIVGVHLDSGLYELSKSPSVRQATDETLILTPNWLTGFLNYALPGVGPEGRRDPSCSPLYADLSGLPPVLITVGALDPLVDDSMFLAARWRGAGNMVDLDVWPEGAHAFTNMGAPLSAVALARTTDWLTGALEQAQIK